VRRGGRAVIELDAIRHIRLPIPTRQTSAMIAITTRRLAFGSHRYSNLSDVRGQLVSVWFCNRVGVLVLLQTKKRNQRCIACIDCHHCMGIQNGIHIGLWAPPVLGMCHVAAYLNLAAATSSIHTSFLPTSTKSFLQLHSLRSLPSPPSL
jgi:hypothetical protein